MTDTDYAVSPTALDQIADGIEAVQEGLRALAPSAAAEQGRGIERLATQPGDVGHVGLNTAFAAFCRRWEWGVRAAVRDGGELVDGLRATAATYQQADDDSASLLARVVADLVGDPADPDGGTWAQLAAVRRPDLRPLDVAALAAPWRAAVDELVEGSSAALVASVVRGEPAPGALDDLRSVTR